MHICLYFIMETQDAQSLKRDKISQLYPVFSISQHNLKLIKYFNRFDYKQQIRSMSRRAEDKADEDQELFVSRKGKRRDIFENAAIKKNILQNQHGQFDYFHEQKHLAKEEQNKQDQIIDHKDDNINSTNEAFEVKGEKVKLHEVRKKDYTLEGNGDNFIFEGSQSDENFEQEKVQIIQHGDSMESPSMKDSKLNDDQDNELEFCENENQQIIFEDDENNEEKEKQGKVVIQLFGQKVYVDKELVDSKQKEKEKVNNSQVKINKQQGNHVQPKKQLLRGISIMPLNTFAKLKLIRNKSSGGTVFSLCLESNMRFIMACKHVSSSSYIISQSMDIFQENGLFSLGKIKTSFFGNELNLFTRGENPKKAKQLKVVPRQLVCTVVTHKQQIMDQVKPRQFSAYILKQGYFYYRDLIGVTMYQEQEPLDKLYNQHESNRDKIWYFENRKSKWNEKQKMFSLNMKGRAKIPSIKNFILESPSENGRQVMLLGKSEQNEFSFDIHHPMSPFLAMGIAMTSFAHKSW